MVENSGIEWTHHTFNPWIGCSAVSPACDHCYAKALVEGRMGRDFAERRRTAPANWRLPLRWNRRAAESGVRERVFCASLADVFDNRAPDMGREDLFALIRATPALDWLLLTKRPGNIVRMLPPDWGAGYANVWLGTTVENQEEADRRIPHLLNVPARLRFLSCEPLLGPVDLSRICLVPRRPGSVRAGIHVDALVGAYFESGMPYIGAWDITKPCPTDEAARRIGWVIVGGESGPAARPMHPDWARGLRDQCGAAGVPLFFKQWGEWGPADLVHELEGARFREMEEYVEPTMGLYQLGKRHTGALLDGHEHREFPA